jgi:hypothetical protein
MVRAYFLWVHIPSSHRNIRLLGLANNRISGRTRDAGELVTGVYRRPGTEGASLPANLSGIKYRIELATLKSGPHFAPQLSAAPSTDRRVTRVPPTVKIALRTHPSNWDGVARAVKLSGL